MVVSAPLNGGMSTNLDFESAISSSSSTFSVSGALHSSCSTHSGLHRALTNSNQTCARAAAAASSISISITGMDAEIEITDSTTGVHGFPQTHTHTSSTSSFTPYQHQDSREPVSMPMPTPATPCTGSSSETDCVTATATGTAFISSHPFSPIPVPCAAANGTQLVGVGDSSHVYTIICDIDFPAEANIYPFVPAGSFDECLMQCEIWNGRQQHDQQKQNASGNAHYCAGFVFAPERIHMGDNCYLKSSVNEPGSATIHLVGATLVTGSGSISRPNPTTWSSSSSMVSSRPTGSGEC